MPSLLYKFVCGGVFKVPIGPHFVPSLYLHLRIINNKPLALFFFSPSPIHLQFFFSLVATVGSDHGVKAQGDGWLLTVALIEGSNLAAVDSSGFSDPYVVFTCNGRTKTSSIKFQKLDPQWNG